MYMHHIQLCGHSILLSLPSQHSAQAQILNTLDVQPVSTKPCVRLLKLVMQGEVLLPDPMKVPAVHHWHASRQYQQT